MPVICLNTYSAPAPSGPALVQQKTNTINDASGNLEVVFDVPVTENNSVIAMLSFPDTATFGREPEFTDGGSQALAQAVLSTTTGVVVYIYYLHLVAAGSQTVRFGTLLPVGASISVSEWSGLGNAAPEDTSDGIAASSTTLTVVPATMDPTSLTNLVVGIGGYVAIANTYVSGPTNSFIRMTLTGNPFVRQEEVYLIRTADHSAVTSTITLSGAVTSAGCAVALGGA